MQATDETICKKSRAENDVEMTAKKSPTPKGAVARPLCKLFPLTR
jgi:hypothetical protein